MFTIRFPNGEEHNFETAISLKEVLRNVNLKPERHAIAGRVNGVLVDSSCIINHDIVLEIVARDDADGLSVIRHSTAHLLAYAVKILFPDAKVAIGPVIENGFYYDFSYRRTFTLEDMAEIENKMRELVQKDEPIIRKAMPRQEAATYFQSIGETYKCKILESIPGNEQIMLCTVGNFTDLCCGPHVSSTGSLTIFKLMRLAGAYWRDDAKNEMLQRVYGTAWASEQQQRSYLAMLEESDRRDHRKLGQALDLFHFQEEAPGLAFWHPNGWTVWLEAEKYLRHRLANAGYLEIKTPQVLDKSFWERSGHWQNYREYMFATASEKREYAIKPMSCPGHIQVFNRSLRSYRDLPIRFSEFGACHRNEPSGALHGLMRVRGFVQDDAHIFCTEKQVFSEARNFNQLALSVYRDFGFDEVTVKLSLRPAKRAGSDEVWDLAENELRQALRSCEMDWEELPGEGAFYGPKVEYHIKDALGRSWQCGTLQLDFVLPERLGAEYMTENDLRAQPAMLHRAIFGSFERFIGIIVEHYGGALPVWLSPVHVIVMNITESQSAYAEQVVYELKNQDFRVKMDLRNEKISYKVREHSMQKIPYFLIVGDKEREAGTVSVRARGNMNLGVMSLNDFKMILNSAIVDKR
ncbi:threonine--tRNA ligase [Pantoea sp. 18069]|uniref:threonine--tRNA ligase n=1 Tax=Pantoea sp. 18069 TaxID=2681415 RepID=UPI00135B28FC|nr:threonine--tRNA ligase [Pantoea sp. 18069]